MFGQAPNVRPSLVKIGVKEKDLAILRNVKYLEEFANEFNNKDLSLPFRSFCKMLYCFINFGYVDMESREDILMDFFLVTNPSLQNYLDFFTLVDNFWKEEKLCGLIKFFIQERLGRKEHLTYSFVNSLLLFNYPFHMTRQKKAFLEPYLNDSMHLETTKAKVVNALKYINTDIFTLIPNEKDYNFDIQKKNFFYQITNLQY